jgi:hypothetical protein
MATCVKVQLIIMYKRSDIVSDQDANEAYKHCCDCDYCNSTGSGGAIYVSSSVKLESCELISNTCSINGGAVFTDFGATALMTDCISTGNRAGQAGVSMLPAYTYIDSTILVKVTNPGEESKRACSDPSLTYWLLQTYFYAFLITICI